MSLHKLGDFCQGSLGVDIRNIAGHYVLNFQFPFNHLSELLLQYFRLIVPKNKIITQIQDSTFTALWINFSTAVLSIYAAFWQAFQQLYTQLSTRLWIKFYQTKSPQPACLLGLRAINKVFFVFSLKPVD